MKNLFILLFCLLQLSAFSQKIDRTNICCYSVQVISSTIFPYPYEDEIDSLVQKHRVYVEKKSIKHTLAKDSINSGVFIVRESVTKEYYRYLVWCSDEADARKTLKQVQTKFPDSYIVYYYKNGRRFN